MAYKTPGVYVQEITTFPPSVVAVETAIPAFVGYTEKAVDSDGNTLQLVPTRIKSLLEYETLFGKGYVPAKYAVKLDASKGNSVIAVESQNASNGARRFYLYDALRNYYANGGGPCYIVSVDVYAAGAPAVGAPTPPSGLRGGVAVLARQDEPTLLVFPDGVSLTAPELATLQNDALDQCATLQDRFVIMDLKDGNLAASVTLAVDPVGTFRNAIGTNNLKYGAAYYPWVRTIYRPDIRFRQLALLKADGSAMSDTDVDNLSADPAIRQLVTDMRTADAAVTSIVGAVSISAAIVALSRDNFPRLTTHYANLVAPLRPLAVDAAVGVVRPIFVNPLTLARACAIALRTVENMTLPPAIQPTVKQVVAALAKDDTLTNAIADLVAIEKNAVVRNMVANSRSTDDVATDYTAIDNTVWTGNKTINSIAAKPGFTDTSFRNNALSAAAAIQSDFEKIASALLAIFGAVEFLSSQAEQQLFAKHPVFGAVVDQVQGAMAVIPSSGAMAGVYAAVDRARGVWKAPANVSLSDVIGPTVKINDAAQADLNVTTTGKSVNAIRSFAGKGTLIWGARTLAGNDNEWRYVPVRRFFNMAEESIRKATAPFVFEPNDANTWVRVRAMIDNFLTVQWRQGALVGATPAQAFYVKLGLGETMTAQDILEGYMLIEVGMAVVRPAEFIVLKFAHKMQVS